MKRKVIAYREKWSYTSTSLNYTISIVYFLQAEYDH